MISGQLIAVSIMFLVTVMVTTLLCLPITAFKQKSRIINFYWTGFWTFLAVIAGAAGGSSSLMILGLEDQAVSNKVFSALITAYVTFVVVGWFHLSGQALLAIFRKARRTVS